MAIEIDKKTLKFTVVEGQAADVKTTSETVYEKKYSAAANGTYSTSHQKEETSFWIRDAQGREYSIKFRTSLVLRDGHDVRVVYARWDHEDVMYPIAVHNLTMKTVHRRELDEIVAWFSIRLRSDSGCVGVLLLLFTILVGPIVGGINWGEKGATIAFVIGLCVFLPYVLIPPHKAKKKRQSLAESLDKELRQVLSLS